MSVNEELSTFLDRGLERGLARDELSDALLEAGWPDDQVRSAMGGYAEIDFPIPVPRPQPYLSAREAFIYLVLFSTLYITAFQLGTLVFQLIERAFPNPAVDPAFAARANRDLIRLSISLSCRLSSDSDAAGGGLARGGACL